MEGHQLGISDRDVWELDKLRVNVKNQLGPSQHIFARNVPTTFVRQIAYQLV